MVQRLQLELSSAVKVLLALSLYDVHALATELDDLFYGQIVPKKLKIGVFGCINSLGKAKSQDIA